jgi:hypothetical protein
MAGPVAGILLPDKMTEGTKAGIRVEIQRMSTIVEGDNFWIQNEPFILILGEEYEGQMDEYKDNGVPSLIGWVPHDEVSFAAMCNGDQDHLLLGELCLRFVRKLGGLVNFGGPLPFPMPPEVADRYWRGGSNWAEFESYSTQMTSGIPGKLYTVPYVTANNANWVYQIGDVEFMEAWLKHPHFHMVK